MGRNKKPTPRAVATELIDQMRRQADPKRAASSQRYFKEPVEMYGLDTAAAQAMIEETLARVRDSWTVRDATALCNRLVRDPHLEPPGIGYQIVAGFARDAGNRSR